MRAPVKKIFIRSLLNFCKNDTNFARVRKGVQRTDSTNRSQDLLSKLSRLPPLLQFVRATF